MWPWDAAANGIRIPTLCHHPELTPAGSCRLCAVEIEGWRTEAPACAARATEGMVVRTDTPRIERSRRAVLEMLLSRYRDAHWGEPGRPESEFEHWCRHYGVRVPDEVRSPGRHRADADPAVHRSGHAPRFSLR